MDPSRSCGYDTESDSASAEVIIVGGGISGIITACQIFQAEPSIKIMLLESTEILGGQVYKTYCCQDLGAKFIKKDHRRITELLKRLEIPTRERSCGKDNGLKDISTFSSVLSNFETRRFLQFTNLIAKEYKYGDFQIERTSSNTMERYINKKLLIPKSKRFAKLVVRLTCGVDAENVTIAEFLAACFSCGSSTNITDLYFGRTEDVLEFDTNELMAQLLKIVNDHVLVRTKSHVVEIFGSGKQYTIRDAQSKTYKCTVIVLAIPWNAVMRLDISPDLPPHYQVPYIQSRSLINSFTAKYTTSPWKDRGLSGSLHLDDEHPLICFETDPVTLSGIVLHSENSPVPLAKLNILERLEPYFGESILKTSSFAVRTFEQGTILNHPQTEPLLNIVWASSCGSLANRGLLDGSVESGLRAAFSVIKILRPERCECHILDDDELVAEKIGFFKKFCKSLNLKEGLISTVAVVATLVTYQIVKVFLKSK